MKSKIGFIYFIGDKPCPITLNTIEEILSLERVVITIGKKIEKFTRYNTYITLINTTQFNEAITLLEKKQTSHLHRLEASESLIKSIQAYETFLNENDFNYLGDPKTEYTYSSYNFSDIMSSNADFDAWTLKISDLKILANTLNKDIRSENSYALDTRISLIYQYRTKKHASLPFFSHHLKHITLEEHLSVRGVNIHSGFSIQKSDTPPPSISSIRHEKHRNDYNLINKFSISKLTPWTEEFIRFGSHYNPAVIFLLHDQYQDLSEISTLFNSSDLIQYCGRAFQKNTSYHHNKYLKKLGEISPKIPLQMKDITTSWWNSIKVHHPKAQIYAFSYVPGDDWLAAEALSLHFEKHADIILLHRRMNKIRKALLMSKLKYESIEGFKDAETIEISNLQEHINSYLEALAAS